MLCGPPEGSLEFCHVLAALRTFQARICFAPKRALLFGRPMFLEKTTNPDIQKRVSLPGACSLPTELYSYQHSVGTLGFTILMRGIASFFSQRWLDLGPKHVVVSFGALGRPGGRPSTGVVPGLNYFGLHLEIPCDSMRRQIRGPQESPTTRNQV